MDKGRDERYHYHRILQYFEAGTIFWSGTESGEPEALSVSIDAAPLDPNRSLDPFGDLERAIKQIEKTRRDERNRLR